MKNTMINLSLSILMLVGFTSCVEDDYDIGVITAPSNLNVEIEVVGQTDDQPHGDGSGAVNFTASANNAISYTFIYSDGFKEVSPSGSATHNFTGNGINDYSVTVIASGTGGLATNSTSVVTVFSDFSDPETRDLLTGGSTKTWYVAAAEPGHLGVGASSGEGMDGPGYYAAAPFEKAAEEISACFYTDEMTFSLSGENIEYVLDNKGFTFFNAAYAAEFGGGAGPDECLAFDPGGTKSVSLAPSSSGLTPEQTTGTVINIAGGGFMSYYSGASSYEVLSITQNSLYVRSIMGNDPSLAWYLKFTTTPPGEEAPGEDFETEYTELLWEQTFDAPLDTDLWNFELGNNEGWGNAELQYYTQDNVSVEDGNLVITARAEPTNGFDYSSSRITTQNNFQFQYGRIEARAKLPEGGGTWPAIWMLGSNFSDVGWPESGEIDIMEHVGNDQNTIHGTLHYPGRSGGNADGGSISIENASSEFHIYTMEWSAQRIVFLVDGQVYHTYQNSEDSPFHQDFFLIMNVAMGGTFGGAVSADFEESSMEVDYIRVFQ